MQVRFLLFFLLISEFSSLGAEDLKSVLKDAYNFFPDIKKSQTEFENSKKDLQISKTDFLPSIEFSASQARNLSKTFPDTSKRNFTGVNPTSFDIDLTQPLSYSKVINLKQAKNSLKISNLKDKSVIQNVLFRASKAYYTVLKDYFLLDVSKKNEENLTKKLEATEKRFEFRDITKTDVFQAKARLAGATSKRIEAENNLDISISDFETVVGRKPDINWFKTNDTKIITSNPKDWSKFGDLPKIPNTLEESIATSLKKNPDYVQTLIQYENAKFDIKKSSLNFTPEFSVSGTVAKSLESSRSVERKDSYSVTASVTLPIFNKGHNILNREKSKNSAVVSMKAMETKKLDLVFEIQSAWKKIESTRSSIASLEISVESNLMAVEGVSKEAGVGTRTTLEILDAEQEVTESESNLVNAQYELIISSFELLKLCGLLNFSYLEI